MANLINFTLPELNGEVDDKTIKQIKNYLYQLTEQMKFYLNNIDTDNFTEDYNNKLNSMISEASTNAIKSVNTKNLIARYRKQFEKEIEESAKLITGNKGGYVVFRDSNNDSFPDEILIMDTSDIETAQKIWRWNKSGLMFENKSTGSAAEIALTMDGKINANMITTGILKGIRVEAAEGNIGGWDITEDAIKTSWSALSPDGRTQINYTLTLNAENNSSDYVIELTDGTSRHPFRIKRDGTADFNDLGVNNLTVAGDFDCLGTVNFLNTFRLIWEGARYMDETQTIDLKAPDLAPNRNTLKVVGNFKDNNVISVDCYTMTINSLTGRFVYINNEKYMIISNTEKSITLNSKITVSNNTVITPDNGSYILPNQMIGLLLVFATYNAETGSINGDQYHVELYPKVMVNKTLTYVMSNNALTRWSTKMIKCTNNQIIGQSNNDRNETTANGITYDNHSWVLSAVYGI